ERDCRICGRGVVGLRCRPCRWAAPKGGRTMTAVGKILVFLNLVFSLVVGGFVVFAYVARVHWVESYKALEKQNEVLAANAKTYQNEATTSKQEAARLVAKEQADRQKVEQDLDVERRANDDLRDQLSKLQKSSTQEDALGKASVTEVSRRQEEVGQL